MDRTVKGTIAVVIVLFVLAAAVFGSYLPLRKSQTFIGTLQGFSVQPPASLQELESRLAAPLDYPSPVGQEELVRNTANSILSLFQRGLDATSTAALLGFLNGYYDPVLERGRGMSFGQDLYLAGAINEIAFARTGNPAYLQASQKWYEEGEALGPNRPQVLYGLFDVYRAEGNVSSTEMIAGKILTNWPTESQVSRALAQFLAGVSSTKNKK